MTLSSVRPDHREAVSPPANDNKSSAPADLSILDLLPADEDVADIARRAENLGVAVVIAIALCFIAAPVVYVGLRYL
ncbi:MAG: hypothetical protein AB1440_07595 [Pseudomonadota bacterium]